MEFEDARAFVNKLGLKSIQEWNDYTKSPNFPDFIPKNPQAVYSYTERFWRGMPDFIGYNPSYKPLAPRYERVTPMRNPEEEQIKQWMIYNQIKNEEEYKQKARPHGFPQQAPMHLIAA